MFTRSREDVEKTSHFVDWGNGTSHRLLTKADEMGFTICHTVVRKGSESLLEYRNHKEACYCISGKGEVEDMDGNIFPIEVGVVYVLPKHEKHYLRASDEGDMVLVSVFNPPLNGDEVHNLDGEGGSSY